MRFKKAKIFVTVCGVAKAGMRSWAATGNDLLNAIDVKEGMEYAGGIKNTKVRCKKNRRIINPKRVDESATYNKPFSPYGKLP